MSGLPDWARTPIDPNSDAVQARNSGRLPDWAATPIGPEGVSSNDVVNRKPAPDLRSFIKDRGLDPAKLNAEQALSSGLVDDYIWSVRGYTDTIPDGPEKVAMLRSVQPLVQDQVKFKKREAERAIRKDREEMFTENLAQVPQNMLTIGTLGAVGDLNKPGAVSTLTGAAIRNATTGVQEFASTLMANTARADSFINPSSARIPLMLAQDQEFTQQIVSEIDNEQGLQKLVGHDGAQAVQGVAQSIPQVLLANVVGGPQGVYMYYGAQGYNHGLVEADKHKITGAGRQALGAAYAATEVVFTHLFSKAGQQLGLKSFEEALTPGARHALGRFVKNSGAPSLLNKAIKGVGGAGLEILEEETIDQTNQMTELLAGTREEYDFQQTNLAGLSGLIGGATANTLRAGVDRLNAAQKEVPEVAKGVKAAEDALDLSGEHVTPRSTSANVQEFFESADSEMLSKVMDAKDAKSFERLTGIKDTTETFRNAFRDTVNYYRNTPNPGDIGAPNKDGGVSRAVFGRDLANLSKFRSKLSEARSDIRSTAHELAVNQRISPDPRSVVDPAALGDVVSRALPQGTKRDSLIRKAIAAQTFAKQRDVLEATMKEVDKVENRSAQSQVIKALRWAKTENAAWLDVVEDVKNGIDFGTQKSRKALEARLEELKQNDMPIPESEVQAFERLTKTPFKEMTTAELDDAANAIVTAVHQHRTRHNFLALEHQSLIQDTVNDLKAEIESATPLPQTDRARSFRGLVGDKILGKRRTLGSQVLSEFGKRPEDYWDRISERLSDVLWDQGMVRPENVRLQWDKEFILSLEDVLDEVGLSRKGSTFLGKPVPNVRVVDGEVQFERQQALEEWREGEVRFGGEAWTRDELAEIVHSAKDPENLRRLQLWGAKKGDRKLGPLSDEDLLEAQALVGPKGEALSDFFFQVNNTTTIDRANAAHQNVYGHPLSNRRQHVPRASVERTEYDESDPLGATKRYVDKTLESYPNLKKRVNQKGPLDFHEKSTGLIDTSIAHTLNMHRYAAHLESHRDARKVLDGIRDDLKKFGGVEAVHYTEDKIARTVVPPVESLTTGDKVAEVGLRGLSTSLIAGSPTAALLSGLGLLNAAGRYEGGWKHLRNALAGMADPREYKRLNAKIDDSPVGWHRYNTDSFLTEWTGGAVQQSSYLRPTPATQILTKTISEPERVTSVAKMKMAEEVVKARGITEDNPRFDAESILEWERMMYRTESSSVGTELNGALAWARDKGPIGRASTAFLNAASKQFSLMLRGVDEIKVGNRAKGAAMVGATAASVLLTAIIRDIFSREEIEGNYVERIMKRAAVDFPGMIPLIGPPLEAGVRRALDMKVWPNDSNLLADSVNDVTDSGVDLGSEIAGVITANDKFDVDELVDKTWNFAKDVGNLGGAPIRRAEGIGEQIGDILD